MNVPRLDKRMKQDTNKMKILDDFVDVLRDEGYPQWAKIRKELHNVFEELENNREAWGVLSVITGIHPSEVNQFAKDMLSGKNPHKLEDTP